MHSVSKQWNRKHGYIIQRLFSMESARRQLLRNRSQECKHSFQCGLREGYITPHNNKTVQVTRLS
jgi:hypothetical protein